MERKIILLINLKNPRVKKILCNELLFTHTSPCEFYKPPDKHWPKKKQDKLPQVLLGGQDKLFLSSWEFFHVDTQLHASQTLPGDHLRSLPSIRDRKLTYDRRVFCQPKQKKCTWISSVNEEMVHSSLKQSKDAIAYVATESISSSHPMSNHSHWARNIITRIAAQLNGKNVKVISLNDIITPARADIKGRKELNNFTGHTLQLIFWSGERRESWLNNPLCTQGDHQAYILFSLSLSLCSPAYCKKSAPAQNKQRPNNKVIIL